MMTKRKYRVGACVFVNESGRMREEKWTEVSERASGGVGGTVTQKDSRRRCVQIV